MIKHIETMLQERSKNMTNDEKYMAGEIAHNLRMEGRRRLSVTGVIDVDSFDDNSVIANTSAGTLIIKGSSLHIDKLSLDAGELTMSGQIDSLEYEESTSSGEGFFARLFK